MPNNNKGKPTQNRFNRKFINLMMIVVIFLIFILYNMPGSIKPWETDTTGNDSTSDTASTETVQPKPAPKTKLETLKTIDKDKVSEFPPLDIQHWVNDDGAKVYFVRAPEIPMLDIRLVFDAGAARDGDLPGLARLTTGMLEEGSEGHSVDEIAAGFESLGAVLTTSSHRDMGIAELRTLTSDQYLQPALDLFAEVIAKPAFPEDAFDRVRKIALLSLQQKQQDPQSKISDALWTNLYSEAYPYGNLPDGTRESLNAITVDDLRDFHQQYYVAKNMVIAMVGDIERNQAETIADRLSSPLPSGQAAPEPSAPSALKKNLRKSIPHPSTQTHLRVATHGIKRDSDDYFALYLGNEILGGGGFTSLLNQEVRQKRGFSYSIYSYLLPMSAPGPFVIGLQTKSESAEKALEVVKATLNQFIENGPTEDQLTAAKRHVINSFPLRMGSNSNIVGQLGAIGYYDLPLDYLNTYLDNIQGVTRQDVKQAFQTHFGEAAWLTLAVGPTDN